MSTAEEHLQRLQRLRELTAEQAGAAAPRPEETDS